MKYAILGDIHANLEALRAVLEDAQKEKIDDYVCVGDLVGYAANPNECVEIIQELGCPVVKGNWDAYASTNDKLSQFRSQPAASIRWTRKQLSAKNRQWLGGLELVRHVGSFSIVHATLDVPERWAYVMDKLAAASNFRYQNTPVCFYGHTHSPLAFVRDNAVRGGLFEKLRLDTGKHYFINVGSVGQPRDGDPRAGYVIYDIRANEVRLRRLPYNVERTIEKIRKAGL